MTRDYKHKVVAPKKVYKRRSQQQTESVEKKLPLRWVWLGTLVLSGVLAGGFFIVQHFATHGVKSDAPFSPIAKNLEGENKKTTVSETPSAQTDAHQAVEAINVASAQKSDVEIEYTFYQGLAETEVVVKVEPISVKLDTPYMIQAGTFTTHERALKELTRLKQAGLDLTLSSILYQNKRYYRLRMGPFDDRLELNKQRNVLRGFGVDTLLIRQK